MLVAATTTAQLFIPALRATRVDAGGELKPHGTIAVCPTLVVRKDARGHPGGVDDGSADRAALFSRSLNRISTRTLGSTAADC
jgi:hypothetical protein